jgi:hypothetical protein
MPSAHTCSALRPMPVFALTSPATDMLCSYTTTSS